MADSGPFEEGLLVGMNSPRPWAYTRLASGSDRLDRSVGFTIQESGVLNMVISLDYHAAGQDKSAGMNFTKAEVIRFAETLIHIVGEMDD